MHKLAAVYKRVHRAASATALRQPAMPSTSTSTSLAVSSVSAIFTGSTVSTAKAAFSAIPLAASSFSRVSPVCPRGLGCVFFSVECHVWS